MHTLSTKRDFTRASFSSKNLGGFTLIELLVVIAIIGMLSSIVFASLNSARQKGRIATVQGTLRSAFTTAILCMDSGQDLGVANGAAITGGTTNVCDSTTAAPGTFGVLPGDWAYTMVDKTSKDGTFNFKAASTNDGKTITCTEAGCI